MDWEGARGLECDNVLCVHRVWVMQVSMFSWSVTMCSVFMGLGYTGEHVLLECDDVLCVHGVWVMQVKGLGYTGEHDHQAFSGVYLVFVHFTLRQFCFKRIKP